MNQKVKKILTNSPWTPIFVLLFLLVISLALLLNQKDQNLNIFASFAKTKIEGDSIKVEVSLSPPDKKPLEEFVKGLGFSWSGEDFLIKLDKQSVQEIKDYDLLQIGFKPTVKTFHFGGLIKKQIGSDQLLWKYAKLIPSEAFVYLEGENLTKFIDLPGLNVFSAGSTYQALLVEFSEEVNFALISELNSKEKFAEEIYKLSELPKKGEKQVRTEGASTGYTKGVIENTEAHTLTVPGSNLSPTYSVYDENIVLSSRPDFFKKIIIDIKKENVLPNNNIFKDIIINLPTKGTFAMFVNFKQLKEISSGDLEKYLDPYVAISFNERFDNVLSILKKSEAVGLTVNENGYFEGFYIIP